MSEENRKIAYDILKRHMPLEPNKRAEAELQIVIQALDEAERRGAEKMRNHIRQAILLGDFEYGDEQGKAIEIIDALEGPKDGR